MVRLLPAKVARSITAYQGSTIEQVNTEAFSVLDPEKNVVVEITPYPSLGLAQIVTMTEHQSHSIAQYSQRQSKVLREIGRADLLLDITYVPERNWKETTLKAIPSGSAVFPVLDAKTVPLEYVKQYISKLNNALVG